MISLIVTLILVGVALYVLQLIPMDATIKRIVWVLILVFALLYILQVLGIWSGLPALRR